MAPLLSSALAAFAPLRSGHGCASSTPASKEMGFYVSQSPLDSNEKLQWTSVGEQVEQSPLDSNGTSQWQGRRAEEEQQDGSTVASPTSSVASVSSSWSGSVDNTLIIFDWDDTLLCSSALDETPRDSPSLRHLEASVDVVLRTAMCLGETIIVTNGCSTWVQESSRAFLPGVVPLLDNLAVTSARAMYEHLHPADPASWKRRAFRKILQEKRDDGHEGLNLVVLGDQSAEMTAVHSASKVLRGQSLIKTVKFVEAPSVEQLIGQLRKVAQELGSIVCAGESSSMDLSLFRSLPGQDHLEAWASSWTFSLGKDWSKCPGSRRSQEDDDRNVVQLGAPQEYGPFGTVMQIEDNSGEILIVNPFQPHTRKARRSPKTPICGLCPWNSNPEVHERVQDQAQVLSI